MTTSSLSVLFLGTQMAIGGAQRLLLDQARWFKAQGHDVTAVFFYDKEGLLERWREGLTYPLMTLSEVSPKAGLARKGLALLGGLFRLSSVLRRGRFDVIETFTYDSNLLALPVAWLAGVPVRIATNHGIIEGFPRWVERLHTLLINSGIASTLVSVSRKTFDQAARSGIHSKRMIVIQNGIPPMPKDAVLPSDSRRAIGLEQGELLLLSVGRLVYQKGHEFLVRAMPRVLQRFPRTKVAICGDGFLRSELERQISALKLQDSVRLLGNRSDINAFLNSADIFVLPSRWEGLPVALLEAMGSGLPVVATSVEGVEEVVQNGIQGLLVPPEDSEALSEALLSLIASPERRKSMGRAGERRVAEDYTTDIMCAKYLQVMRTLLPQRIADR